MFKILKKKKCTLIINYLKRIIKCSYCIDIQYNLVPLKDYERMKRPAHYLWMLVVISIYRI